MKSSRLFFLLTTAIFLLHAVAANAAGVDMNAAHRGVGREDNVRIDAQLMQDSVTPGVPVGIDYQIENLSTESVAIADRVVHASYDPETLTITLAVGSEVPDEELPHMILVSPGEKKVLRAAATPALNAAALRASAGGRPRYVQVKVSILRDLTPFHALISNQSRGRQRISNDLFDRWFESNDTILLNSVPVQFNVRQSGAYDADSRSASRGGGF